MNKGNWPKLKIFKGAAKNLWAGKRLRLASRGEDGCAEWDEGEGRIPDDEKMNTIRN